MSVLTLLHHTPDADGLWITTPVAGAPQVTLAMERALRRRCTSKLDKATDPVRWWHCEGWGAVLDLHQTGHHDDAMDLARLLYWCDEQAQGCWEITRTSSPGGTS